MFEERSIPTVTALKNPAYTGANRCTPCTVLNVLLAAALAGTAGVLSRGWTTEGGLVAVAVFLASAGVIYLRGYLLPGTPALTKRFLPEAVLARFDKLPTVADGPRDPGAALRAIGVVEDAPTRDDLVLVPAFERAWLEATAEHAATDDALERGLAAVMELDGRHLEVERRATSVAASHEGTVVGKWESRAACQADVAAAAVLPRFDPRWARRPVLERLDLLATLRLFLEECPACGGEVSFSHEVVESCCRSHDVVATTCGACSARLLETPIDAAVLESESE